MIFCFSYFPFSRRSYSFSINGPSQAEGIRRHHCLSPTYSRRTIRQIIIDLEEWTLAQRFSFSLFCCLCFIDDFNEYHEGLPFVADNIILYRFPYRNRVCEHRENWG